MSKKFLTLSLAILSLGLSGVPAGAADTPPAAAQAKPQVYGSQLMTRQERIEYRNKMRSLKTQEEREAFRLEHHKLMRERAKERGVALPETPPARGAGIGPGAGMGPGGGMGPGRGPNQPAQ